MFLELSSFSDAAILSTQKRPDTKQYSKSPIATNAVVASKEENFDMTKDTE